LQFEWDNEKSVLNIKKHNVSFKEASTVFKDSFSLSFYDPNHSIEEDRYILIGISQNENFLVIAYTERNDKIRIISARKGNKKERESYESKR